MALFLAVLLSLAPWMAEARSHELDPSMVVLAKRTRLSLAERIEPPAARLPFACLQGRTETAPMREIILRQQAEAIGALVASANTQAERKRVRRLLDALRREGYSSDADARLAESAPGGATGLRLAGSLGELPTALDSRLATCGTGSTHLLSGRTLQSLGSLARTDYERLVALEPTDPWHPLVLAWLSGVEGEPMLRRALAVATARGGDGAERVRLFSLQQLAWLRRQQGRGAEAERAARDAMALAEERLRRSGRGLDQPGVDRALLDAAQTGSVLARTLEARGHREAAIATLREVVSRQRRVTTSKPGAAAPRLQLVESLQSLAQLSQGPDPVSQRRAKAYMTMAVAEHQSLLRLTPTTPMVSLAAWKGMVLAAAAWAAGLTLVLGWLLLLRYRQRIAQLMLRTAERQAPPPSAPRAMGEAMTFTLPAEEPAVASVN
ncbi:MAG: hypothetical protein ACK5QW_00780, partial [Cyanobacteriota bacterium]